jgi:hypothetical protein
VEESAAILGLAQTGKAVRPSVGPLAKERLLNWCEKRQSPAERLIGEAQKTPVIPYCNPDHRMVALMPSRARNAITKSA